MARERAWYAIDPDLEENPKFLTFRRAAGLTEADAVLALHRLWSLASRKYLDGVLCGHTTETLEDVIGVVGSIKAMTKAGFLHQDGDAFVLHDWMDWNGAKLKARIRQERYRQRHTDPSQRNGDVTVQSCPRPSSSSSSIESTPLLTGSVSDDVVEPQENGKALRREWESAFSEHFWPKYPRKVGKAAALRSWRPLLKGLREIPAAEKLLGLILDGLDRDLDTEWAGRPNDKIPHPATWIHQRRWEDDR